MTTPDPMTADERAERFARRWLDDPRLHLVPTVAETIREAEEAARRKAWIDWQGYLQHGPQCICDANGKSDQCECGFTELSIAFAERGRDEPA